MCCRFENAVSAAEKADLVDYGNVEIAMVLNNVKMVVRARTRGNDLFSSGKYAEACSAYGEGLKYDSFNSVLYCNRAVCWSKLGLWEKSIEDCNEALRIQPNYTKALLRRAVSNEKVKWHSAFCMCWFINIILCKYVFEFWRSCCGGATAWTVVRSCERL